MMTIWYCANMGNAPTAISFVVLKCQVDDPAKATQWVHSRKKPRHTATQKGMTDKLHNKWGERSVCKRHGECRVGASRLVRRLVGGVGGWEGVRISWHVLYLRVCADAIPPFTHDATLQYTAEAISYKTWEKYNCHWYFGHWWHNNIIMNTLVINMSINKNSSQITRLITLLLENAQSKHPQRHITLGIWRRWLCCPSLKTLWFSTVWCKLTIIVQEKK